MALNQAAYSIKHENLLLGKEMKGRVAKYEVPYLEFVLCISPIQVHTHSSE